ncbi:Mur ligase family protein [Helicobacter sp. 23-1048]
MSDEYILGVATRFILNLEIAFYFITLLQWYNYSLFRVFFRHHKPLWHIWFFLLPAGVFITLEVFGFEKYCIVVVGVLFVALCSWRFSQDKPLKFTKRVIRFFILCFLFLALDEALSFSFETNTPISHILPLIFGHIVSKTYEFALLKQYKKMAKEKLERFSRLKIIAITASYGKTSIKNYLRQILGTQYAVYATPRSVNTLAGIIADINENLTYTTDIYIAEAGARQKGDIDEIAQFLNPQYAIIGEIGEQHLEYFKNLANIVETKFELLHSNRLKKAYIYEKNLLPHDFETIKPRNTEFYPAACRNVNATLDGTTFELKIKDKWVEFETQILGTFNAHNIAVAVSIATELGIKAEEIVRAVKRLEPTEHRLQKIEVNQKLIIDDSFNGNLNGMLEAVRLSSLYNGRRVIITPGIVESTKEANIQLAKKIDEVFDIAIITGSLNTKVLSSHIKSAQKIILPSKESLETMLKACTLPNDLVLFSNDAPSFI